MFIDKISKLFNKKNSINDLRASILNRILNEDGTIRLAWAATTPKVYYANLGDALSAVMVTALSGRVCKSTGFRSPKERLLAVGTIAQHANKGVAHIWGTGMDARYNAFDNSLGRYAVPPDTQIHVHATRGVYSQQAFLDAGINSPKVYGDPVWLLPSILPPAKEKVWDLGVIVHIAELTERSPDADTLPEFVRYQIPAEWRNRVKIINTLTEPTWDSIAAKMEEITSCRRLLSTSLHGIVFGESYRIPCLYFALHGSNACKTFDLAISDEGALDSRFLDLYTGLGCKEMRAFGCDRTSPTDWAAAIAAIDEEWRPACFDTGPLLDAFPLPLAFDPRLGVPFKNFDLLRQIKF